MALVQVPMHDEALREEIARVINPRFDRLCRDDEDSAGAGTQGMVLQIADRILSSPSIAAMREENARLREALYRAGDWMTGVAQCDFDEIVADGGITAGMVIRQEAAFQAQRARHVLIPTQETSRG